MEPEEVPGAGRGVPGFVIDQVLLSLVLNHGLDCVVLFTCTRGFPVSSENSNMSGKN